MSARSAATASGRRASTSRAAGARKDLFAPLAGLKEDVLKPSKRPAMRAGSAFAAYMTLLFASVAVWWGLSNLMDQGWAASIVSAVWAIVCVALYAASKRPPATRARRG
jgi:hypothetical protein